MDEWVTSHEAAQILGCIRNSVYDIAKREGVCRKPDPECKRVAYLYNRAQLEAVAKVRNPHANRCGRANRPADDHPWKVTARTNKSHRPTLTADEWAAVVERARARVEAGVPHRDIPLARSWSEAMGEGE